MRSYFLGIGLYLFSVVQTILVLMIASQFRSSLSEHFSDPLDAVLYLTLLLPFFFIGGHIYKKWIVKGQLTLALCLLALLVFIPLLDAILLRSMLFSLVAFPLCFGYGFPEIVGFAISNSIYAVILVLAYSSAVRNKPIS